MNPLGSLIRSCSTLFPRRHLLLAGGVSCGLIIALLIAPSSDEDSTLDGAAPGHETHLQLSIDEQHSQTQMSAIDPEPIEFWVDVDIKSGDTLSAIFSRQEISPSVLHSLVNSGKKGKLLSRITPGQTISFLKNDDGQLSKLKYSRNRLNSILYTQQEKSFSAEETVREPDLRQSFAIATIESSLFMAAQRAGLSQNLIMQLANVYAWDIDFALDIRQNDSFKVIYTEKFLDGEKISDGNILAAEFTNQGKTYTAVRYTDAQGNSSFYSPDGKSMRKAFLRNPIEFARISSRFNLKRKHPVLNKIRAHRGVDYAASTGTPIRSAGDGKIKFIGRKGGFGNTVIVQHGQRYNTLYAHMSKYKRGLRNGSSVKQGQVIGFVGSTGLATGPHLHYEFRVNGAHVNPQTVKLPSASPIAKSEKQNFQLHSRRLLAQLEASDGSLALND